VSQLRSDYQFCSGRQTRILLIANYTALRTDSLLPDDIRHPTFNIFYPRANFLAPIHAGPPLRKVDLYHDRALLPELVLQNHQLEIPYMKLAFALFILLFVSITFITNMKVTADGQLKTRPESTNYEETSRYEDVIGFINELNKRTDNLRSQSFGKRGESSRS
jgi:hypothetical protein